MTGGFTKPNITEKLPIDKKKNNYTILQLLKMDSMSYNIFDLLLYRFFNKNYTEIYC